MLFAALCFYQLDLPSLGRLTNFAYLLLYATIDTSEQGEMESVLGKQARKASAESELENGPSSLTLASDLTIASASSFKKKFLKF